ncbi:MAG: hypothetical protein KHZ78_05470 [Peptoniphilus sp. oral taxon 375]|nr:hypothetical protein [Peptoniphilus sp. oral taxon 375]
MMREVTIKKGKEALRVTEKVFRVLYEPLGYRIIDTPEADPKEDLPVNLYTLKVEALRKKAKEKGLDPKGKKKEELIEAIKKVEHDS